MRRERGILLIEVLVSMLFLPQARLGAVVDIRPCQTTVMR